MVEQRLSNYILIVDFAPGFKGLGKDNCEARRNTFKFYYLMRLISEVWRYHVQFTEYYWCDYLCMPLSQLIFVSNANPRTIR